MKKIIFFLLLMIIVPSLCLASPLEKKEDIIRLNLLKETVIAPDVQTLTIDIGKPLFSTPKQFMLKLTITGPAIFDDNKKENVIEYPEISSSVNINKTIRIEKYAMGIGETINISYTLSYKSSFFGKIDENFRVFMGSLSFRGAASEKAACEVNLQQCNNDKNELNQQIISLNSQVAIKDSELSLLKNNLSCPACEEKSCSNNLYLILILSIVIIGLIAYEVYRILQPKKTPAKFN